MNPPSSSALARLLLAIAYPVLAHWASHDGGGALAALALADLVVFVTIDGLLGLRWRAWAATVVLLAALAASAFTPYAQMLLLAPPMLFNGWLAWWFGRSLRAPREALITRIVAALHEGPVSALSPELYRYTRRLTALWAVVLTVLALVNGALAMIAVPDGVLARLGQVPPVAISQEQWSWFANLINYGVVVGMFAGEYLVRQRRFPVRPESGFFDFMHRMAKLGPGFWRELFS
ncbi:ketosynthase [Lysobacter antibioticus]|uniref:ketosynthase n=1 Tax=Lysobacter antibioticus TaxID=84531 RepID=UPI000A584D89|nr:ketosynthase [Lysobacter antibioticus]